MKKTLALVLALLLVVVAIVGCTSAPAAKLCFCSGELAC